MRLCIIGKYPPIQGGVSARTYWSAHALAARGHEVHVVTNGKEATSPFRIHMRGEDWTRCEAQYGPGSVTVHWTDPVDRMQSYIPMASPFVSKLATVAARAHSERPFDLIYSHYLEPYGVAAHLAAQMTGVPHVARMAGSDAGRLWHHPQLGLLYDHVLRSAATVIADGPVAERAGARGVDPDRIARAGGFTVPEDIFAPDGPSLDIARLRGEIDSQPEVRDLWWGRFEPGRPYFGVCGKLGDNKGSFALLAAMQRLKRDGLDVGLVALAHGRPEMEGKFRSSAEALGIADRVLQIPFVPPWRMPEFLRSCLAVCCLEQDFPIGFHSPIIPREVLLCGTCLVASTEMVRKFPAYERLPDRYGCVAIPDVHDADLLAERLGAIVRDPKPAAAVGARGMIFARELQQNIAFPQRLEQTLLAAATGRHADTPAPVGVPGPDEADDHFPLTRLAASTLGEPDHEGPNRSPRPWDRGRARNVLSALEARLSDGHPKAKSLLAAVTIETAIAEAEAEATAAAVAHSDPLFRLHTSGWALDDGAIGRLVPLRDPHLRVLAFDYDVSEFIGARTLADLPAVPAPHRSFIVTFGPGEGIQRDPLVVDPSTARILELSDGRRTAAEIVREIGAAPGAATDDNLGWIERLFVAGLLSLQERVAMPDRGLRCPDTRSNEIATAQIATAAGG